VGRIARRAAGGGEKERKRGEREKMKKEIVAVLINSLLLFSTTPDLARYNITTASLLQRAFPEIVPPIQLSIGCFVSSVTHC